jgi:hypothetical protein
LCARIVGVQIFGNRARKDWATSEFGTRAKMWPRVLAPSSPVFRRVRRVTNADRIGTRRARASGFRGVME